MKKLDIVSRVLLLERFLVCFCDVLILSVLSDFSVEKCKGCSEYSCHLLAFFSPKMAL